MNSDAFNYEMCRQYVVTVTVTDDGLPALSDTNTVVIEVADENDYPTLETGAVWYVRENRASGTAATSTATDAAVTSPVGAVLDVSDEDNIVIVGVSRKFCLW